MNFRGHLNSVILNILGPTFLSFSSFLVVIHSFCIVLNSNQFLARNQFDIACPSHNDDVIKARTQLPLMPRIYVCVFL